MRENVKEVESASEYKEAIEAIETLGLEIKKVEIDKYGIETKDGSALHVNKVQVNDVGYKWININFGTNENIDIALCGDSEHSHMDGKMYVYFG
jgi:hypothetical protein